MHYIKYVYSNNKYYVHRTFMPAGNDITDRWANRNYK
jgi:hypothetical protein